MGVKTPKTHINQTNEDQTQGANIKSSKGKAANNTQGDPIRITADLSIAALQTRREWLDILKVMKEKNLQPRILYPARISFRYEGEIKSFTDKQKLREFSTTKPALQQMLKDFSRQETQKRFINSNAKQQSKSQWDHTYQ